MLVAITFTSCQVDTEEIAFEHDQCNYCKMSIVDRRHAAQFVTKKGKQYKYDSIECMVHALNENNDIGLPALLKVADYETRKMTDAGKATYLISPEIRSPMGEFLSAFETQEKAILAQKQHSGTLYSWDELKQFLKKKKSK